MSHCGYNNENQKPISRKYVYQTFQEEASETSLSEILELIHNTNDIVLLTRAFYLLGLYLLSEESGCDKIIKCKVLYDKILIVLSCGMQTKVCIALNLISALLFFGDEQDYSRRQTLHIYAQNMIITSGCLTAMCELFTNCMMRRGTMSALCVSLSAAAGAAQAQCAHLVSQCVERCRQEQSEMFPLLQILLSNSDRNIQLFHESNGMTIFTRESLQQPGCLHLLSTLAENQSPQNKIILNQSTEIFEILPCLLSKYGPDSLVGKWALIILYSRQKAIKTNLVNNLTNNYNDTAKDDTMPIKHNKNEERKNIIPNVNNDTSQLFRNIYKEIMTLKQQEYYKPNKKTNLNCYRDILDEKDNIYRMNYKTTNNRKILKPDHTIYKDKFTSPSRLLINKKDKFTSPSRLMINKRDKFTSPSRLMITKTNDLSFSFLKRQNTDINTKTRCTENVNVLRTSNLFRQTQLNDFVKHKQSEIEHSISNVTKTEESIIANNTIFEFKPPFVSTPKHSNTRLKSTCSSTSWSPTMKTLSIKQKQDKLNTKVQKAYKTKYLIRTQLKEKQNKSMSTKFFDLINGSRTTLVKSFNNIKNIFKRKRSEDAIEETNNITCSYSFTNYMHKRDAYLRDIENNTIIAKELIEETNDYCNTCNDTIVLRQKFKNDKSLQKTIQKLKLGINLYGCNFKKISRTMWPRETYMTPSVLYNLYRKLIIK